MVFRFFFFPVFFCLVIYVCPPTANGLVCWIQVCLFSARVRIAVGITSPNRLAVFAICIYVS